MTVVVHQPETLSTFRCNVMDAIIEYGARPRHNISYRQLAEAIGRPTMLGHHLAYPLGDIGYWCHRAGLPILTSIVVSEQSEEPSEGFWDLIRNLYKVQPANRKSFLANMQDSVFAYWGER